MESYEISKEEYKNLKNKYNLKTQVFKGNDCHNCTHDTYRVVTYLKKYYYECTYCGVLDND